MSSIFDDLDQEPAKPIEIPKSRIESLEDEIQLLKDQIKQQGIEIKSLKDRIKELESHPIGHEHLCHKCGWKWKSWDSDPKVCAQCHVKNWKGAI